MNQPILLYRSGSVYANETAAWAALDAVTHKKGQPIVAFYTLSSPVSGHHGSSTIGAIFAIGIGDGVGQYKACTSHDDMLIVAQSLNAHITQFNQMFEYDAINNAIKAKLDFYTTDGKSISAGGIGSGSSASLGALYQLVDVMANSSNTGVEGAVEGSVLAYDATAGKWKAIAQSEILPDMSGYYTKDETDSAINTAKSNLQGQVDTLKALIPATASATNQLADKDFVNSSIATATAEFRGSFTSLDELKATSGNLNDYAFYLHTDSIGNSIVDRYKWTTAGWLYEYTLNNSSFTAEQWAALNSAITATLVQSYNSHLKNTTIHITSAERTAWNNKWDYNEETIKGVKVNAAVNADNAAKVAGLSVTKGNNYPWGTIPAITDGGYMDVGRHFEFHYDNTTGSDYSTLLTCTGNYSNQVYLPSATGTLALLTDNVASATKLQDNTVFTAWGQTFFENGKPKNVNGDLTEVGNITASGKATIQGHIVCGGEVVAIVGEGTPAGVTDYSALTGKPSINGVTLVSGNNTLVSLGIQAAGDYATNSGVTTLLANYADKTFVANNYVGKAAFNSHTADTDIHITAAERVAWNAKWDYNEATIKAVKVNSASSADKLTTNAGTSAIPIYFKNGKPAQCIPSDLFSGFDNAYSSTETSLGITIAGHTRMVVVAYSQTAGSVAWTGITGKPTTFTPSAHTHTASDVSGLPTSLKNPYALTFGSKTYDGSAAKTITASDLGALTAHQTIYALTLQVNGTSQGVYKPASAAKTINIAVPTKTSQITNDSGFITSAAIPTALKNPYAVEIKANGVSLGTYDGSKAATFNLSANNVGAASKIHTHTASDITGLPTKLSAFTNDVGYITGITKSMVEGVLTGNITSHTHSYLPLSGGTIKAYNASPLTIKVSTASNLLTFITTDNTNNYIERTVIGYYASSTRGSEFRNATSGSYIGITDEGTPHYNGNTLIHAGNYNSYAPTLTGTGASGTWGINISGNAATATNATNADTLDGYHHSDFVHTRSAIAGTDLNSYDLSNKFIHDYKWTNAPESVIGSVIDLTYSKDWRFQIFCRPGAQSNIYARSRHRGTTWTDWNKLAYITDNVASAAKLKTPRSIWGQSFDGTSDVNGDAHIIGDLIVDGEVSALVA